MFGYSVLVLLCGFFLAAFSDVSTTRLEDRERVSETLPMFGLRPDQVLVSEELHTSNPDAYDIIRGRRNRKRHRAEAAENNMIVGSRRAIEVTRVEYLRKNRCKTQPFIQVVRVDGCLKRKVINRFCYGQCNTFYIPKLSRKKKLTPAFENCSTCKADDWEWVVVTLRCPGQNPPLQHRRIQNVKTCKCSAE